MKSNLIYPPADSDVWYAPASDYHLVPHKKQSWIVISSDAELVAEKKRYRLDRANKQTELFDTYINIYSQNDALHWAKEFGLPAFDPMNPQARENAESIRSSAASLRELLTIRALLEFALEEGDTTCLEDLIGEMSAKSQTMATFLKYVRITQPSWFRNYKWPARKKSYLEELWKKGLAGQELSDKEDNLLCSLLDAFCANKMLVFLCFDNVLGAYYSHNSTLTATPIGPILFHKDVWNKDKPGCIIHAAREYLAQAASIMLKGVQPRLKAVLRKNQSVITDAYPINCPWHAIAIEFARTIRERSVNLGQCQICKESLEGMRPLARVCRKARCRKQAQRTKSKPFNWLFASMQSV